MSDTDNTERRHPADEPSDPTGPHALTSGELFRGNREVLIEHNGETYRLRITRTGKLILNK